LQPGWLAESVEDTEVVLVVPLQKRTLLGVQLYNGAPELRRYKYDVDVRMLEAQTGKLLAQKHFQSVARPIRQLETFALTELGDPVQMIEVYRWMKAMTKRAANSER